MDKEFVPYAEALELKELGFDEPCIGLWNLNNGKYEVDIIGVCKYSKEFKYREVLAPLYQQVFRWFRKKGIISEIHSDFDRMLGYNRGYIPVVQFIEFYNNGDCYETYEEAELACLRKLIEIVKNK